MKALTRFLLGMIVLSILGMAGVMLFAQPARSQVTDLPVRSYPPSDAVMSVDLFSGRACVAWWKRSEDRYGDYVLSRAAVDGTMLLAQARAEVEAGINARDLIALNKARTHNLSDLFMALQPCLDKLPAPPRAWIVAPIASGERPAYILNPDGTRGPQNGYVPTTLAGEPHTCYCKTRSVETTSSTYCLPAQWKQTQESEQVRVTLCREVK